MKIIKLIYLGMYYVGKGLLYIIGFPMIIAKHLSDEEGNVDKGNKYLIGGTVYQIILIFIYTCCFVWMSKRF